MGVNDNMHLFRGWNELNTKRFIYLHLLFGEGFLDIIQCPHAGYDHILLPFVFVQGVRSPTCCTGIRISTELGHHPFRAIDTSLSEP